MKANRLVFSSPLSKTLLKTAERKALGFLVLSQHAEAHPTGIQYWQLRGSWHRKGHYYPGVGDRQHGCLWEVTTAEGEPRSCPGLRALRTIHSDLRSGWTLPVHTQRWGWAREGSESFHDTGSHPQRNSSPTFGCRSSPLCLQVCQA